jgi:hypothetical protein
LKLKPYTGAKGFRTVAVDSVPFPGFGHQLPKGVTHKLDGSNVLLSYKAFHKPTQEAIAQAQYATVTLKIDRRRYTGRLIDVFHHKGTLYCLLGGVLERDRGSNRHGYNFRTFNLDDGNLLAAWVEEVQAQLKTKRKLVVKGKLGTGKTRRSKVVQS